MMSGHPCRTFELERALLSRFSIVNVVLCRVFRLPWRCDGQNAPVAADRLQSARSRRTAPWSDVTSFKLPHQFCKTPLPMNEVTVTFDRVFDIVRRSQRNRVPCTEFGFQAGDVKKYGIAAPGSPRIEAGMTVTAVLQRPGDWQTLLGWVNHETGEIACRSAASEVGGIVALIFGGVWAYYLARAHPIAAALVLVVAICICVGSVIGMRRAITARRLLDRAWTALTPRDFSAIA